jgi:hypothetical protein
MDVHQRRGNLEAGRRYIDVHDCADVGSVVGRYRDGVREYVVYGSASVLCRVAAAPYESRTDLSDTMVTFERVEYAQKTRRVARDDTDRRSPHTVAVVRRGVEAAFGDCVILAALKDRLHVVVVVHARVLFADPGRASVDDDIGGFEHPFDAAGYVDSCLRELVRAFLDRGVKRIAVFDRVARLEVWLCLRDADEIHVVLENNGVRDAFPYGSVPVYSDVYHGCPSTGGRIRVSCSVLVVLVLERR